MISLIDSQNIIKNIFLYVTALVVLKLKLIVKHLANLPKQQIYSLGPHLKGKWQGIDLEFDFKGHFKVKSCLSIGPPLNQKDKSGKFYFQS